MSFSIDLTQALTELRTLLQRMSDFVPVYDAVGAYAIRRLEERVEETKLSPEGTPWAPWKPFTADLRDHKGNYDLGINWDTGDFLHSFSFSVDGNFEVVIESNSPYVSQIQNGDPGKRAARPVMGWAEKDLLVIQQCAINYFETGYARIRS